MRLILQDGFRFVHIPSDCMVKSKCLAQFPVDHLPYPVVSIIIIIIIIILGLVSFSYQS